MVEEANNVNTEPSQSLDCCEQLSPKLYIDNCFGILQEVPNYLDFGLVRVELSSLAISPNFISLGSRCGALFLFDRNYGRALRPLRTTYNEVCTCQSWFCRDDRNFLAIGHYSGTLVLLCLPSGKLNADRKLKQSINESFHKDQKITCLEWDESGKTIYSGDAAGLVLSVKVDFKKEVYKTGFIHQGKGVVKFLRTTSRYLVACFKESFAVFDLSKADNADKERFVVAEMRLPQSPIGLECSELESVFLLEHGRLVRFTHDRKRIETLCDLSQVISRPTLSVEIIVGGMPRETYETTWKLSDFWESRSSFYGSNLLIYSKSKVYLLCQSNEAGSHAFSQVVLLDLRGQLNHSKNLEILESVFDEQSNEIFVLTSTQKLIRLSTNSAAPEIIGAKSSSMLLSLTSVAQNSSKKLYKKFTGAGDFQRFKVPIQLPHNIRFPASSAVIEELGSKLAHNLSGLFENLQPLTPNESCEDESDFKELEASLLQMSLSKSEMKGEGSSSTSKPEVKVMHKANQVIRKNKSLTDQTMAELKLDPNEDEADLQTAGVEDRLAVPAENLDKLLQVLSAVQLSADSSNTLLLDNDVVDEQGLSTSNQVKTADETEKALDLVLTEDLTSPNTESLCTLSDHEEDDLNESTHSIEQAIREYYQVNKDEDNIERQQRILTLEELIDGSTPSLNFNAAYPLIARLANQETDVWTWMKLPYMASSFDVCSNYIVICSNKRRVLPQYRLLGFLENGVLGRSWSEVRFLASSVAVNDSGNLLWRVESGVALAPCKIDCRTPYSEYWLEQATEEIGSIALTTTDAWYLTNLGMNLPEMGILFRAECPYKLSQIAASDVAVWGLVEDEGIIVARVGLQYGQMGSDWVEYSVKRFVSIALYDTTGFGLDFDGELWICNDISRGRPFGGGLWLQACPPTSTALPDQRKKFAPIKRWQVKACKAGVFINVGGFVLCAQQPLTAHHVFHETLEHIIFDSKFKLLTATSFLGDAHDYIYISQPSSDIFAYSTQKKNLTSLPYFDSRALIVTLSAARDLLYVLDSHGVVHIRDSLNSRLTPRGKNWILLDIENIASIIVSFAASLQSLWAVSSDGEIWSSDSFHSLARSNWKTIDPPPNMNKRDKIDRVQCSPSGNFVWLISSATYRMWAMSCLHKEDSGWKCVWVEVYNKAKMLELAVTDNAVYGLSTVNNQVYRLRSVSVIAPNGLYWKALPLKLRAISADMFEGRIWGLDMNYRLVKHYMEIYPEDSLLDKHRPTVDTMSSMSNGNNSLEAKFAELCPN